MESVSKMFAPCVGVVDAASFFIGNCRFGKEPYESYGGDAAQRLRGHPGIHAVPQKRQGETLEIPANSGFDDDVSAISAHTLEEMERLRLAQQKSKLQTLTPLINNNSRKPHLSSSRNVNGTRVIKRADHKVTRGVFSKPQLWTMQHPSIEKSDEELSIGVSTSGSSSAGDNPTKKSTRGSKTRKKALI
jgi:hypothetical protein